jgi:hypothetical protein
MPNLAHIPEFLTRPVPRQIHTVIDGVDVVLEDHVNSYDVPQTDAFGRPIPNPERERVNNSLCVFHVVDSITGRFSGKVTSTDAVRRIAQEFRRWGVKHVIGDHYEQFFAASEFGRWRLQYHPIQWTAQSKPEAITRIKRLLVEDRYVLPPSRETLKKELLNYSEKISATGHLSWSARNSGHDDECSLLISLAHGELENLVPGAPLHIPKTRHEQALSGGLEMIY